MNRNTTKRKLSWLLIVLITFAIAGCDLFGGDDSKDDEKDNSSSSLSDTQKEYDPETGKDAITLSDECDDLANKAAEGDDEAAAEFDKNCLDEFYGSIPSSLTGDCRDEIENVMDGLKTMYFELGEKCGMNDDSDMMDSELPAECEQKFGEVEALGEKAKTTCKSDLANQYIKDLIEGGGDDCKDGNCGECMDGKCDPSSASGDDMCKKWSDEAMNGDTFAKDQFMKECVPHISFDPQMVTEACVTEIKEFEGMIAKEKLENGDQCWSHDGAGTVPERCNAFYYHKDYKGILVRHECMSAKIAFQIKEMTMIQYEGCEAEFAAIKDSSTPDDAWKTFMMCEKNEICLVGLSSNPGMEEEEFQGKYCTQSVQ
jgi:hypothetical protein